jgi:Flavoprotein
VLYIVAGGAGPVTGVGRLVDAALGRGWDTCLILTPTAAQWLAADLPGLAGRTGHPVRSSYKMPGEADVLPPASAMLVAPATFNMINQWAAGLSETLALGLINEAIGLDIPIVAVPWVNEPLGRHPAFGASVARLRGAGVTVLEGVAVLEEQAPDEGAMPWDRMLDALPGAGPA